MVYKISVFFFLCIGVLFANALDIEMINGIWIKENTYNWIINNPEERHLSNLTILEGRLQISWDKDKNSGVFIFGMDPHIITEMEQKDNEITMKYDNGSLQIVFKIISHDILQVISHPYNGQFKYLNRIYDPAIPTIGYGTINNDRVRFRNKPELTSGTFHYLDKGEIVFILGISDKKQKINEMEEYWYEICIGSGNRDDLERAGMYITGWVYGAYIDIKNKTEFEEKLNE